LRGYIIEGSDTRATRMMGEGDDLDYENMLNVIGLKLQRWRLELRIRADMYDRDV